MFEVVVVCVARRVTLPEDVVGLFVTSKSLFLKSDYEVL